MKLEILDKQSETGILLHNIYDLKPLKSFVYGRTILLGDAAHATTPNMGARCWTSNGRCYRISRLF